MEIKTVDDLKKLYFAKFASYVVKELPPGRTKPRMLSCVAFGVRYFATAEERDAYVDACGMTQKAFFDIPDEERESRDREWAEPITHQDLSAALDDNGPEWIEVREDEHFLSESYAGDIDTALEQLAGRTREGHRILHFLPERYRYLDDQLYAYLLGTICFVPEEDAPDGVAFYNRKEAQRFLDDPREYTKETIEKWPVGWGLQRYETYLATGQDGTIEELAEQLEKQQPRTTERRYQIIAYNGIHQFGNLGKDCVGGMRHVRVDVGEGDEAILFFVVYHIDEDYAVVALGRKNYLPAENEAVLWTGQELPEELFGKDPSTDFIRPKWLEWCQSFDAKAHVKNRGLCKAVADPDIFCLTDETAPREDEGLPCCAEIQMAPCTDRKISSVNMSYELFRDSGLDVRWNHYDEWGEDEVPCFWGYVIPNERPADDTDASICAFGQRFLAGAFTHFSIRNIKMEKEPRIERTEDTFCVYLAPADPEADDDQWYRLTFDRTTGIFAFEPSAAAHRALPDEMYDIRYAYTGKPSCGE